MCNCQPWWVLVAVSDPWWKVTGGYGQVLVALTADMLKALKEYSSFEFCTALSHIVLNNLRHAVILAGNCVVVTVFP